MAEVTVKTYRVKGYYYSNKAYNKQLFETEMRAVGPDDAVKVLKQQIVSRAVNSRRIHIESIVEITSPEFIKDRVVKTFATEKLKV
jgi:ribosomal protein L20A (L18A)